MFKQKRTGILEPNRVLGVQIPAEYCDKCQVKAVTIGGLCWPCFNKANEPQVHYFSNHCHLRGCPKCANMRKYA